MSKGSTIQMLIEAFVGWRAGKLRVGLLSEAECGRIGGVAWSTRRLREAQGGIRQRSGVSKTRHCKLLLSERQGKVIVNLTFNR